MSASANQAAPALPRWTRADFHWLLLLAFGIVCVAAAACADISPFWLPAILLLPALAGIAVWRPDYGILIVALSIGPLGTVQFELAGVTINYPETLLLLLFVRELPRLWRANFRWPRGIPYASLALFLAMAATGLGTAALRGNGAVAALQDCRQYIEYIICFLLVPLLARERRQVTMLFGAFSLGMALLAAHGILQHYFGWGIPRNQLVHDRIVYGGVRSGSFYGATALGALMVLGLGPAASLVIQAKQNVWRVLFALLAMLLLAGAYYTRTRAAWLAIALMFAIMFVYLPKRPGALVAAAVVCVLGAYAVGPKIVQRLSTLDISRSEKSLWIRTQYYGTAFEIIRAHPLLGLGWGPYFDSREVLGDKAYLPEIPPMSGPGIPRAESTVHSAYLQLAVRIGLPGLAAFLFLLLRWGAGMFNALRSSDRTSQDYILLVGCCAAIVAYLAHASIENFFQWPVMSQSFWLLLGASTVLAARVSQPEPARPEETSQWK